MTTEEYTKEAHRIGFTDQKAIEYVTNTKTYNLKCRKFDVVVEVSKQVFQFNNYQAACVVTSEVKISDKLPANGFGSHCYYDEATTMEEAIAKYCEEEQLTIYRKVCSWPYALAVASK